MTDTDDQAERARRWKLAVGGEEDDLYPRDAAMSHALSLVYNLAVSYTHLTLPTIA